VSTLASWFKFGRGRFVLGSRRDVRGFMSWCPAVAPSSQCIVGFIGATLEKPRIIVTEFMARGSLLGILRDTSIELPTPLRLQMALDMALGPRAGRTPFVMCFVVCGCVQG